MMKTDKRANICPVRINKSTNVTCRKTTASFNSLGSCLLRPQLWASHFLISCISNSLLPVNKSTEFLNPQEFLIHWFYKFSLSPPSIPRPPAWKAYLYYINTLFPSAFKHDVLAPILKNNLLLYLVSPSSYCPISLFLSLGKLKHFFFAIFPKSLLQFPLE